MKIRVGNLFKPTPEVNAICITTNGVVKKDNRAVMGAGVAKIARDMWPGIDTQLGKYLETFGNTTRILGRYTLFPTDNDPYTTHDLYVIAFPTKEHWKNPSTIPLIRRSALQLVEIVDKTGWKEIWLPPPGCGLGGLKWKDIYNAIDDILDDRFTIIFYKRD